MGFLEGITGAKVRQPPDALQRYLQTSTSSYFGQLRMIPLAFPVFVMNPKEYVGNIEFSYISTLREYKIAPASNNLISDSPESGQVWKVQHCFGETTVADDLELILRDTTGTSHELQYNQANKTKIEWTGEIMLEEGEWIIFNTNLNGNLKLSVIGEKRNA